MQIPGIHLIASALKVSTQLDEDCVVLDIEFSQARRAIQRTEKSVVGG